MNNGSMRASSSVHEVIERYSNMVYRLAYARTGNKADAEDVYQDVFFRYFSKKPEIQSEEHLKAWLIRATIHTSVNLFRSAWRRHRAKEAAIQSDAPVSSRDSDLRDALAALDEKYRIAIYLHYYEGFSTQEIACMTGDKPATIRSRLMRGREKMRKLMAEEEANEE